MRVLHVYSGNLFGGVETMLLALAKYGDACPDMQTEFALCFDGRLAQELIASGAQLHRLPEIRVRKPWSIWRARRRLEALLKQRPFDVVVCHAPWSQALFAPVIAAAGVREIFFAHDATDGTHWLDRWARMTRPNLVISNSLFTQGKVASHFPRAKSETWYLPVGPAAAQSTARSQVRAELETASDNVVIVQTSRMQAWKGHQLLIQALGGLRDVPTWTCWIVGGAQRPEETEYVRALESLTKRLGLSDRIRFTGQRSDVPRLLAAADIHCQPNLGPEPFGIAFIEALYCGLPVVTTRMGAAEELLTPSCSVLVEPNAEALGSALRALIQDDTLRRGLSSAAPLRAHQLCDPSAQLNALSRMLSSLPSEVRS